MTAPIDNLTRKDVLAFWRAMGGEAADAELSSNVEAFSAHFDVEAFEKCLSVTTYTRESLAHIKGLLMTHEGIQNDYGPGPEPATDMITEPGTYAVQFLPGEHVQVVTVYYNAFSAESQLPPPPTNLFMASPEEARTVRLEDVELVWCCNLTEILKDGGPVSAFHQLAVRAGWSWVDVSVSHRLVLSQNDTDQQSAVSQAIRKAIGEAGGGILAAQIHLPQIDMNYRVRAYYEPCPNGVPGFSRRLTVMWSGGLFDPPPIGPVTPWESTEEIPEPAEFQVWKDPKGVKRVLSQDLLGLVIEDGHGWTFVCPTPHADIDYSYRCFVSYCRCQTPGLKMETVYPVDSTRSERITVSDLDSSAPPRCGACGAHTIKTAHHTGDGWWLGLECSIDDCNDKGSDPVEIEWPFGEDAYKTTNDLQALGFEIT